MKKFNYYKTKKEYENSSLSQKLTAEKFFVQNVTQLAFTYMFINSKIKITEPLNTLKKANGNYTKTSEETIEYLMEELFQNDNQSTDYEFNFKIEP